ncbi:MAG: PEGA domain-containing protein [Planctomycetes bacterium]|nr:PEGA domain-containing protein [Planctomycetota bacterium]
MKKMFLLSLIAMVGIFSGCATLVAPGPDIVPVSSMPTGADVSYNGHKVGETPVDVPIDRHQSAVLTVEKEGYNPVTITPNKVINGWVIGSICLGLIPVVIDFLFDDVMKYSTKPITVTLSEK